MSTNKDNLYSKTREVYWSDGLLDVLVGIGVCLIGFAWIFDMVAIGAVAPAIIFGLMAIITSLITKQSRFMFYAICFAISGMLIAIPGYEPGWALLAGGILTSICGLIVFAMFMTQHPRIQIG